MKYKPGQSYLMNVEIDKDEVLNSFRVVLRSKVKRHSRWECRLFHIPTNADLGIYEILEDTLDDCFKLDVGGTFKGMAKHHETKSGNFVSNNDPNLFRAQQLEIILFMDWAKIHKTMTLLDWEWTFDGVPSELMLIQQSITYLNTVIDKKGDDIVYGSGGLKAAKAYGILSLDFVVADWDGHSVKYFKSKK